MDVGKGGGQAPGAEGGLRTRPRSRVGRGVGARPAAGGAARLTPRGPRRRLCRSSGRLGAETAGGTEGPLPALEAAPAASGVSGEAHGGGARDEAPGAALRSVAAASGAPPGDAAGFGPGGLTRPPGGCGPSWAGRGPGVVLTVSGGHGGPGPWIRPDLMSRREDPGLDLTPARMQGRLPGPGPVPELPRWSDPGAPGRVRKGAACLLTVPGAPPRGHFSGLSSLLPCTPDRSQPFLPWFHVASRPERHPSSRSPESLCFRVPHWLSVLSFQFCFHFFSFFGCTLLYVGS